MARKAGIYVGEIGIVRAGAAIIAADNATLTDANIPVAGAFNASGLDTVFIGVEIDAGSSPTMTIEFLFRDANAADGSRWKRLLQGARPGVTLAALTAEDSGALDGTKLVEMRCWGYGLVFPRITAVANAGSTTGWRILAMPGQARNTARLNAS